MRNRVIGAVLALLALALVGVNVQDYWSSRAAPPSDVAPPGARPLVLVVGDSYAAGAGGPRQQGWVDLVADELGWSVLNQAVAGTGFTTSLSGRAAGQSCGRSTCPSFREAASRASWREVDRIVVSGGRHDESVPTDQESRAIDALFDVLAEEFPGVPVVATNPLWDDTLEPASLDVMADRLARVDGITFLDLGQPLLFEPELISDDGLNPNAAGHRAIATSFVEAYRAAG